MEVVLLSLCRWNARVTARHSPLWTSPGESEDASRWWIQNVWPISDTFFCGGVLARCQKKIEIESRFKFSVRHWSSLIRNSFHFGFVRFSWHLEAWRGTNTANLWRFLVSVPFLEGVQRVGVPSGHAWGWMLLSIQSKWTGGRAGKDILLTSSRSRGLGFASPDPRKRALPPPSLTKPKNGQFNEYFV